MYKRDAYRGKKGRRKGGRGEGEKRRDDVWREMRDMGGREGRFK